MLKYILALSLCTGVTYAADFVTGQAARAFIGQAIPTAQENGTSDTRFGAIGGLAFANGTLFATDANRLGLLPNNARVLLFNNINATLPGISDVIPDNTGSCPLCLGKATVILGDLDPATQRPLTALTRTGFRLPTSVASDGKVLAVADTSNNRVLLWKSIPASAGVPADVVLGQADFTHVARLTVTASSMRGPQGVWIQNGKLYVADTQNDRILIWNAIPTQNNQAADVVLGQSSFTFAPAINQIDLQLPATANTMLSPTSVTSDGTRLFVTDLGYNRVLIWNTLPTRNQQPADVEVGQVDMTKSIPNDTADLCVSTGVDANSNPIYPARCGKTLNFPRYALSNGTRLFIADGGNDRVLVYNKIPTSNAARADAILGQPDEFTDVYTAFDQLVLSATNVTPTPTGLAWDPVGQNLYVADPTDYRILVFSAAAFNLPLNGVVNAASRAVFAAGSVLFDGTITAKNVVTVTLGNTDANGNAITANYTHTLLTEDTLVTVAVKTAAAINASNAGAGDPYAIAYAETNLPILRLVARQPGVGGNNISLAATVTPASVATLTAQPSGANLGGGGSAAQVAPGMMVVISAAPGTTLADGQADADPSKAQLPFELGGVQVYFNGNRVPLLAVKPTTLTAQVPWDAFGSASQSAYVRTQHRDGSVTVTTAINVPVLDQNPGIYACDPATYSPSAVPPICNVGGQEPRSALAFHGNGFSTATIAVDGSAQAGDTAVITIGDTSVEVGGSLQVGDIATVTIGGTPYSYTVVAGDTLNTIRDHFVNLINADPASPVGSDVSIQATRFRLLSKKSPAVTGISITSGVTALSTHANGPLLILTLSSSGCCLAGGGEFGYTAQSTDTLTSIRDIFIGLINANPNSPVTAAAAGVSTRIRLQSKVFGPPGDAIPVAASVTTIATNSGGPTLVLTPTAPYTCCAAVAGAPLTSFFPARPGETIVIYSAGLGLVAPEAARITLVNGAKYQGPDANSPRNDPSALVNNSGALVVSAGLVQGQIGLYQIVLELSSGQATNFKSQVSISQGLTTSNLATIPILRPGTNSYRIDVAATTVAIGTALNFTVTALDGRGQIDTGYAGAVHFNATDNTAAVPVNANLTKGVGSFQVTFKTAGSQRLLLNDATDISISGQSAAITVQ